jgi:tetratricopeptide (TPR) repeat protein
MSHRAKFSSFLFLLLTSVMFAQSHRFFGGSISGTVATLDNRAIADARIEVQSVASGLTVASGYSNMGGAFEFRSLDKGLYEVVATVGLNEARQRVEVNDSEASVALHMAGTPTAARGDNVVSVRQLQVPGKARAAFKKAQQLLDKDKFEEAQKQVARALEIYPNYADALTLRAIMRLDAHQANEALADLEAAIKNDPACAMAYLALGAAFNSMSRFDDAVRTLERGLMLSPSSWQGYFEMGKALLGKGSFEAGLRQLNKAESFASNDYPPVHLVKAHAYLGLKNYQEAISELELYLTRDPKGANSAEARQTLDKVRAFTASSGSR